MYTHLRIRRIEFMATTPITFITTRTATLRESLAQELRSRIEDGRYSPGTQLPSLRALTHDFGVSEITVRAALNDLKLQGFVESRPRAGMFARLPIASADKTVTLACVLPELHISFFGSILAGVQSACAGANARLLTASHQGNPAEEKRQLQILSAEADGLIVAPLAYGHHDTYTELLRRHVPLVFVDRAPEGVAAPLVTSDNEGGAFEATRPLLHDVNRRRLWFLSQTLGVVSSVDERLRGFARAHQEMRVPLAPERILQGAESDERLGLILTQQLLQCEPFNEPIGIFVVNDYMARGVYLALKHAGKSIPEDVAIVAFGGVYAPVLDPPLCAVEQDLNGIGIQAAHLMLQMCANRGDGEPGGKEHRTQPRVITLPCRLQLRSSSDQSSTFCPIEQLQSMSLEETPSDKLALSCPSNVSQNLSIPMTT